MLYTGSSLARRLFIVSAVFVVAMSITIGRALPATVTLDGQPVTPVYARDGHLLVPFRAPMERIGAVVDWNAPTAIANMNGAQLVTVNIGDSNAIIKGNPHHLSVAPVLIGGNAYVPVEALGDICGAQVTYSADRTSADVVGCTLANINTIAATGPSFNFWPWLIGLLVLLGALWAWSRSRAKTVYTAAPPSASVTPPQPPNVVRGTVDDYVTRLKAALGQTDDAHRATFVQQLSQTVTDNRSTIPESVVTTAKAAFDASASGSRGAVSALIDQFADRPQLLQMAVKKFATIYPGGEFGALADSVVGAR